MIVHKGEIVERAVRDSGFPITTLAKRMSKSRKHIYNLFANPDVSLDVILQIGKIIHYDFSDDLKEISKIPVEYQIDTISNEDIAEETIAYWKSKYFELVEQHKHLLQKKIKEYFTDEETD